MNISQGVNTPDPGRKLRILVVNPNQGGCA